MEEIFLFKNATLVSIVSLQNDSQLHYIDREYDTYQTRLGHMYIFV